ncbi:hypothetical protein P7K49_031473, partial [Saguinus oedipus]
AQVCWLLWQLRQPPRARAPGRLQITNFSNFPFRGWGLASNAARTTPFLLAQREPN